MRTIRFRLLGSLSLVREDGTISIRSVLAQPKRLSVLAFLAAGPSGTQYQRDALMALFWPDLDERHARKALRQALYGLRQALGPGVITGTGADLVGVDPERIWSDARAFTAAVGDGDDQLALELYRGPLLDGFHLSGSPEFEQWVDGERRRLEHLARDAAWRLMDAAERAGDQGAARRWGERALELGPYDEDGLRRYLWMMGRAGQPAAAVRAYELYTERLARDLELPPSPETLAVITRIRCGDVDALDGTPRRDAGAGPAATRQRLDPVPRTSRPPSPMASPVGGTAVEPTRMASRHFVRRAALFAAAAVVVVLAAFGARIVDGARSESEPGRIVVLPLENRTRDAALDPVGRIAADWLVQGLAATGLVDVVPSVLALGMRAQVAQESGELDPLERARVLARRLGATAFVVGSFHRRAGDLEFQAQIFDAETGRLLDAIGGVRGSPGDPMAAIDELRHRTLGAVGFRFDTRIQPIMTRAHRPPQLRGLPGVRDGARSPAAIRVAAIGVRVPARLRPRHDLRSRAVHGRARSLQSARARAGGLADRAAGGLPGAAHGSGAAAPGVGPGSPRGGSGPSARCDSRARQVL